MKINFKNIIYYFAIAIVLVSCKEDEVNYTPKVYAPSPALTVSTTNLTDTSFDVEYTAQADGVVYYAIQLASDAAPDAEAIIRQGDGSATGTSIINADANLTSGTAWTYTMATQVYGAFDYSIYSVMTSVDGIASSVIKTDVTTPDTMAPTFDRDATVPGHNEQPGTNSPFGTIDLAFSEPVTYQGGDVTFTGFFSGRTITVNSASAFSSNGTTVSIADHGTFAPDDAILVNWGADTFKDKSGKSVDPLTGFGYYFWTRQFTRAEKAKLSPGMYNYSTVFYGGLSGFYSGLFTGNPGAFLPDTGTYEITANTADATGYTLNGINLFSGFASFGLDEPQTLPIVFSATVDDELDLMPNVPSVITAGQATYWSHYGGLFFGIPFTLPGLYDFDAGTITHYLTLYGVDGSSIDDIDYLYTRVPGTTYARSKDAKSMSMDDLIKKSKSTKKVVKRSYNGSFSN